MRKGLKCGVFLSFFMASLGIGAATVPAAEVDQWASTVIAFSSQYGTGSWSAEQALGEPNVMEYGDYQNAWAPVNRDGAKEYLTLGFDTLVFANGVTVRETCGNGFVYRVDVVDTSGALHNVWTGKDPSQSGSPVNFKVTWPMTDYYVKGVKVYVNTDRTPGVWDEIDAVQLHGVDSLDTSKPDLVIQGISGPASGRVGRLVRIASSVKNGGSLAAGRFRVGIYLSTDGQIDPQTDTLIGGIEVPKLPMGKTSNAALFLMIPESLLPGTYYIGAVADDQKRVVESSETNNTKASATMIEVLP